MNGLFATENLTKSDEGGTCNREAQEKQEAEENYYLKMKNPV